MTLLLCTFTFYAAFMTIDIYSLKLVGQFFSVLSPFVGE